MTTYTSCMSWKITRLCITSRNILQFSHGFRLSVPWAFSSKEVQECSRIFCPYGFIQATCFSKQEAKMWPSRSHSISLKAFPALPVPGEIFAQIIYHVLSLRILHTLQGIFSRLLLGLVTKFCCWKVSNEKESCE